MEVLVHSLTNTDNPTNVSHGGPNDAERHIGDWGNFDVAGDPHLYTFTDHVAKLTGPYGIVGVSMSLGTLEPILLWLTRE